MPWCPKCKSEYVDGITECAECKVTLVDELPEEKEPFIRGEEPMLEELKDFLECNGFGEISLQYDMDKAEASLYMDKALKSDKALEDACVVFMVEKKKQKAAANKDNQSETDRLDLLENNSTNEDDSQQVDLNLKFAGDLDVCDDEENNKGTSQKNTYAGTYQNKKDKAADFRSSAYTLLIVGVLGLVALVLLELGYLPIRLAGPGRYMTYIVMGALFIIFIVTGIFSFKSAKKYESQSVDEDKQTEDIKQWVKDNLDATKIREKVGEEVLNLPDEMKYFQYFEQMKQEIKEQFQVTDEAYLDALVEELYPSLFENNKDA